MHSYPLIGLTTLVASMSLPPYQPAVSRFRNKGTLSRVCNRCHQLSTRPSSWNHRFIKHGHQAQWLCPSNYQLLHQVVVNAGSTFSGTGYTILFLCLATQLVFISPRSLPVQVTYHARHYKQPLSDTFETKSYVHCNKIIHVDFLLSVQIVIQWWSWLSGFEWSLARTLEI